MSSYTCPQLSRYFFFCKGIGCKQTIFSNMILTYYIRRELDKFGMEINQKRKRDEKKAGRERLCPSFRIKFIAKNNK